MTTTRIILRGLLLLAASGVGGVLGGPLGLYYGALSRDRRDIPVIALLFALFAAVSGAAVPSAWTVGRGGPLTGFACFLLGVFSVIGSVDCLYLTIDCYRREPLFCFGGMLLFAAAPVAAYYLARRLTTPLPG